MQKDKLRQIRTLLSEDREAKAEAAFLSRDLLNLLLGVIEGAQSPRLSKAVGLASAAFTLSSAAQGFYKLYRRSNQPITFMIKITEDDPVFEVVEKWFMDALPEESQRSVYARSSLVKKGDDSARNRRPRAFGEDEQERISISYTFDGSMAQTLNIAGHDVEVFTEIPEGYGKKDSGGKTNLWNMRSMNISCPTYEASQAVKAELEEQSQYLTKSQPQMYISTRYGDWSRRSEIHKRSLNSVILKEGQMERIVGYLKGFLANREAYLKADIPFRTGILLHGEPGSGKSSTALAIANELRMNVYVISITSLLNDESLSDCFTSIPPNSIVILEDIDIASAVKERDDDKEGGVTMTGMLNVLDGFQSPHGVITIMTTNRLEVLDPAIRRPGRVDLLEELNCLDNHQIRGLCEYFMGFVPKDLPSITPGDEITSAEVMGEIRKHLPDFENAGDDIVKFVEKRLLTKMESQAKLETLQN